jgi:receptor-type tyrosine-protein phosphatase gamma
MPNLLKRKIRVRNLAPGAEEAEEEERIVVHLQYLTWPDHGAPDESDNKIIGKILEFMREYHNRSRSSENKIVVHCSAGIGRSGTIIAIYNIQLALEVLYKNKELLVQSGQYG